MLLSVLLTAREEFIPLLKLKLVILIIAHLIFIGTGLDLKAIQLKKSHVDLKFYYSHPTAP